MLCMSELREYGEYLRDREMSENTVEKYLRDAENFLRFSEERDQQRVDAGVQGIYFRFM